MDDSEKPQYAGREIFNGGLPYKIRHHRAARNEI